MKTAVLSLAILLSSAGAQADTFACVLSALNTSTAAQANYGQRSTVVTMGIYSCSGEMVGRTAMVELTNDQEILAQNQGLLWSEASYQPYNENGELLPVISCSCGMQ